ncbi:MAG: hypothetical protein IV090_18620 [Candidatus Sericytochromatia bacterium]|nr:hypothetical protein [Candidatus Sericytochromatia bacterium]
MRFTDIFAELDHQENGFLDATTRVFQPPGWLFPLGQISLFLGTPVLFFGTGMAMTHYELGVPDVLFLGVMFGSVLLWWFLHFVFLAKVKKALDHHQNVAIQITKIQLLRGLLGFLQADILPGSGLKADLDWGDVFAQTPIRIKHRSKGKKSLYFRQRWADLRCLLIDGSELRIRFEDKYKTQATIVRSLRLQRGSLDYNQLLYSPSLAAQRLGMPAGMSFPQQFLYWIYDLKQMRFRQEQPTGLEDSYGMQEAIYAFLISARQSYRLLLPNTTQRTTQKTTQTEKQTQAKHTPAPIVFSKPQAVQAEPPDKKITTLRSLKTPAASQAKLPTNTPPAPQESEPSPLSKVAALIADSRLRPRITGQSPTGYTLSCQGESIEIRLEKVKSQDYISLRLNTPALDALPAVDLLRANPSLAQIRLGRNSQGQTALTKSHLASEFNGEEFDACLQELGYFSSQFQTQQTLPSHLKRLKTPTSDSFLHVLKQVLAGLEAETKQEGAYFKVKLKFESGRTQKLYLRTDRSDCLGRPVLSLQTFIQAVSAQTRLDPYLAQNLQAGYGALGLAKHGGVEHVVMTECQLIQSASALELETLLIRLAASGDRLERELSTTDAF